MDLIVVGRTPKRWVEKGREVIQLCVKLLVFGKKLDDMMFMVCFEG